MFRLQLSHASVGKSPLLSVARSLQLPHVGLVPGLEVRPQGHDVLLVSVLQELQLAGVLLPGFPQDGVLLRSTLLTDFFPLF